MVNMVVTEAISRSYWSIEVLKYPIIHAQNIRVLSPNILSNMFQNLTVDFSIKGLPWRMDIYCTRFSDSETCVRFTPSPVMFFQI